MSYRIYAKGITPNGIMMYFHLTIWCHQRVKERYRFAWLIEIIATNIIQRIETICTTMHIANSKFTLRVSARDARKRQGSQCRIFQIAMNTHHHSCQRIQGCSIV